ncbi:hypothetical protein TWF694_005326 [Orbilia ellipsospora]|uniref:Peptidase C1A papain C-terminal domain-containing protein n=1 Tax=Orbilia ellipsospora TaxID=2528407 RepID=A0AAV9WSX8_9PEZI
MSQDNRIFALGHVIDRPDPRDVPLEMSHMAMVGVSNLPSSYSLTSDGAFKVPVYDQGSLGSCVSNAVATAYRYGLRKNNKPDFNVSRLFLYFLARYPTIIDEKAPHNTTPKLKAGGTQIRDTLRILARFGSCQEYSKESPPTTETIPDGQWPYDTTAPKKGDTLDPTDWAARPPPEPCYQNAQKHLSFSYQVPRQSEECWKRCIASGYPIIFGFVVHPNFQKKGPDGKWSIPPNSTKYSIASVPTQQDVNTAIANDGTPQEIGSHAVVAVGFDDSIPYKGANGGESKGCFLVQNSWGADWGDNGYFWMPYEYLNFKYQNHGARDDVFKWYVSTVRNCWTLLESDPSKRTGALGPLPSIPGHVILGTHPNVFNQFEREVLDAIIPNLNGQETNFKVGDFDSLQTGTTGATGRFFCDLDFLRADYVIHKVEVGIYDGAVCGFSTKYTNGVHIVRGCTAGEGITTHKLELDVAKGQRIYAIDIESGKQEDYFRRITMIKLYVYHGDTFTARASHWIPADKDKKAMRGTRNYTEVQVSEMSPPENWNNSSAHLKGFIGHSSIGIFPGDIKPYNWCTVFRLAPIWGDVLDKYAQTAMHDRHYTDYTRKPFSRGEW